MISETFDGMLNGPGHVYVAETRFKHGRQVNLAGDDEFRETYRTVDFTDKSCRC